MCGNREAAGGRSDHSTAALRPGKAAGLPTWKDFRVSKFQTPPSSPGGPGTKRKSQKCSHLVLSFQISTPANRGGGEAAIADSVPPGWSAELRGGSWVAAPKGRRQTFEILPQVVTAPHSFQVFHLSLGVRGGGDPAPFAKVVAFAMPCRRSPLPGADAECNNLTTLKIAGTPPFSKCSKCWSPAGAWG